MESIEESAVSEERQCYICLEAGDSGGSGWVSPCRCTGTVRWVHQRCVMLWVRQQELHAPSTAPHCSQCRTRYLLSPTKGPFLKGLDCFYQFLVPAFKFTATSFIIAVGLDSASAVMGVFAMSQVYGLHGTVALLQEYEDTFEAFIHAQMIAYSLIMVSYIPWEDWLLKALRRSSKLPLLNAVLPEDLPDRPLEAPRHRPFRRVLTDALTLPVVANLLGQLLFAAAPTPVHRVMIGGAVYLAVRCSLYMYLSQQMLRRRVQMRVLPVEEEIDEAQVAAEDEDIVWEEVELLSVIEEGEEPTAEEEETTGNEEVVGEEEELNDVEEKDSDVERVDSPMDKEIVLEEEIDYGEVIPKDTRKSEERAMVENKSSNKMNVSANENDGDDKDKNIRQPFVKKANRQVL